MVEPSKQVDKIKTLLVDDEKNFLKQEKIFLQRLNKKIDPETITSPKKALKKLRENNYDCIVSDYQMTEMDGLELLKKVREERNNDIPFIMFTGKGREEIAMETLNLGANRYLQKGGDPKSQYEILADTITQEVDHYNTNKEKMKAEKKTRETSKKLRTIFKSMEDGVIMTDFKGNIIEANKSAAKMAGFEDKEEYMNHNAFEFVHPEDREILEEAVEKTYKEGEVQDSTEYRIQKETGEVIHTQTSTSLIRDDSGEPFATVNIVRNITEQKETEEELRKSRKQFMNIFEEFDDPVFIVSPGPENPSDILEVNPAASELTGYTQEELIGMNLAKDLAYEGPFELTDKEVEKKLRNGETVRFTGRMKDKKDNKHFISITNTPIEYMGETAVLSINRDITEQKKREKKLEKSREEYRELIDGMNDTVWVMDFNGDTLEVNEAAVKRLGYSREELLSMKPHDIDASMGSTEITELIGNMREDEVQVFETVHETKDGEKIPVEISSSLITYREVPAILSIARDLSDRKEAERKFKKLFNDGPEPTLISTGEGSIMNVNSRFEEVFGYKLEEIKGKNINDLIVPDKLKEEGPKLDKKGFKGYVNYETVREGKKGEIPVSISVTPIQLKDKTYIISIYKEITDRKKAEKELNKRSKAMEASVDGISILDENEEYVYMNDSHAKIYGYDSPEELLGEKWEVLYDEEELERFKNKIMPQFREKGSWKGEAVGKKKDGTKFFQELSLTALEDGGLICVARDITERKEAKKNFQRIFQNLGDAIFIYKISPDSYGEILEANQEAVNQTGYSKEELIGMNLVEKLNAEDPKYLTDKYQNQEKVTFQQKKKRKDGTVYWSEVVGAPIQYQGKEAGLSIQRDITAQKKAEKRKDFLQSLLRHDVRNKTQIVQGYLKLLEDYDLSSEAKSFVSKSEKAINDSMKIIEKVRSLRKAEEEEVKEVRVSSAIQDAVNQAKPEAEDKEIEIEIESPGKECKVKGGSLLNQAFNNIIENALQHSRGDQIKIQHKITDKEVICTIEDNGKGIPDEKKDEIFDRGYTTDEERGTGFGLTLVKTLLDIYDGSVEVKDSELGGARFDVHLQKT